MWEQGLWGETSRSCDHTVLPPSSAPQFQITPNVRPWCPTGPQSLPAAALPLMSASTRSGHLAGCLQPPLDRKCLSDRRLSWRWALLRGRPLSCSSFFIPHGTQRLAKTSTCVMKPSRWTGNNRGAPVSEAHGPWAVQFPGTARGLRAPALEPMANRLGLI